MRELRAIGQPTAGETMRNSSVGCSGKSGGMIAVLLIVLCFGAMVGLVLTGCSADRGMSTDQETTQVSTKRTLPPIQTPGKITADDLTSAGIVLAQCKSFAPRADQLLSLINRYPNWNPMDLEWFDSLTQSFVTEASYQAIISSCPTPSEAIENAYHYYGNWTQGLGLYRDVMPLLRKAVETRDADLWDQAIVMMSGAADLFAKAGSSAQIVADYGAAGNVDWSSSKQSIGTSPPTSPQTSTTVVASQFRDVSLPSFAGRPQVLALAPSGKSMIVGKSVTVQAALSSGDEVYKPATFALTTGDPDVAVTSGATITSVGAGSTKITVEVGGFSETIGIDVYPDQDTFDSELDGWGPLWDGPIFTDGRMTLVSPSGDIGDDPATWRMSLSVSNGTSGEMLLTPELFALYPRSGGRYGSNSSTVFYPASEGHYEEQDSSWELGRGENVGMTLFFNVQSGEALDGAWLVFDDGKSLICLPADGDFPTA
jgi:hypothetical protein